MALAHDVAGVARVALAEHRLPRLERARHAPPRRSARGRSRSSVENTGTRPSSSTTSAERIACHRPGIPHATASGSAHRRDARAAGAIFTSMLRSHCRPSRSRSRRSRPLLRLGARRARRATPRRRASAHALLTSRELWATIDVCNPADQPNTVGIRGSMPGDGASPRHDVHELSPAVPERAGKQWVGPRPAARARVRRRRRRRAPRARAGASFTLVPAAGKPAVELRGVVDFQWRTGRDRIVLVTTAHRARPTGRRTISLAGRATPAGLQPGRVHAGWRIDARTGAGRW